MVTFLFANATLEKAFWRKGAARLVLNARENIFAKDKERSRERRQEESVVVVRMGDVQGSQRFRASLSDRPNGKQNLVPEHVTVSAAQQIGKAYLTWV